MSTRPASATAPQDEALFSPDQVPDWLALEEGFRHRVTKIVLGQPDANKSVEAATLPPDLAALFPRLTHLHLWGLKGLTTLPDLPAGLQALDVRRCRDLETIPPLPTAALGTMVLETLPRLRGIPADGAFPVLTDLSLKECAALDAGWMVTLVQSRAPRLRFLNLSGCSQLVRLDQWPESLVDARLDGCTGLQNLPKQWPPHLRRITLRGVAALPGPLPPLHGELDCVDLRGMEKLTVLPKLPPIPKEPTQTPRPRTLYLHGSGILVPPASEHGADADENVAQRTRAFFKDVEEVGKGTVKRCKLLILGNGGAGKSCLAHALANAPLHGQPVSETNKPLSTNGIQFFDYQVGPAEDPTHLHIWDFGGQEIYHNTHQLFMNTGSLFVVVWNPDQGDAPPTDAYDGGYQDERRPLSYWLDFIHQACKPRKPRIALVCSQKTASSPELEARWRREIPEAYHAAIECYYVDSLRQQGEMGKLKNWLDKNVIDLIQAQGTAVPSYWEVAQDLVEGWVTRLNDPKTAAKFVETYRQMPMDRFRKELETAIPKASGAQYAKLREKWKQRRFDLGQERRVERTLEFLTHSGWVYWKKDLFECRVIVGQRWALEGLYAILQRKAAVYAWLTGNQGRFKLSELASEWKRCGYPEESHELLLSFMRQCGLCIQLRDKKDAWGKEAVYVSFEHLPEAPLEWMEAVTPSDDSTSVPSAGVHKRHWQSFLTQAGEYYGSAASYAKKALFWENQEGQRILVRFKPQARGLGGTFDLYVQGPKAKERLAEVKDFLIGFLPESEGRPPENTAQALGERRHRLKVFLSYARDVDGTGIEAPVDAVENHLRQFEQFIEVIRDKRELESGESIKEFTASAGAADKVILLHSDRYWGRPYCIHELHAVYEKCLDGNRFNDFVIPVEIPGSRIREADGRDAYEKQWDIYAGEPRPFATREELRTVAKGHIHDVHDRLADRLAINLKWSDGPETVFAEIRNRLGVEAMIQAAANRR